MPPHFFKSSPLVQTSANIPTLDAAMEFEYITNTTDGTHWTPQDNTSEEQAELGVVLTPQYSMEDGIPDEGLVQEMIDFDTAFPQSPEFVAVGTNITFANEPRNDPQRTITNLGAMENIDFTGHGLGKDWGEDIRSLHGALGSNMHMQTTASILRAFNNPLVDYQASYASSRVLDTMPSGQPSGRTNNRWFNGDYPSLAVPRHVPGLEPWSAYGMSDSRIEEQPSPEELLFGPSSESPFLYTSLSNRRKPDVQLRRPSTSSHAFSSSPPSGTSRSDRSDDTIDRPRPDNPVGPPPEFDASGGEQRRRRRLNTHQRANAALRRREGTCWPCALLKYPCVFDEDGEYCKKCRRMRKKPEIWRCDATPLPDLTWVFIPKNLLVQHEQGELKAFCKAHVRAWTNNYLTVYVTWGYGQRWKCEVREIEPVGEELLYQNQYRLNLATNKYDLCKIASPPLGISMLDIDGWRRKLDGYLNTHLQTEFEGFPRTCFRGNACEVQRDLLYPIHAFYLSVRDGDLPRLGLKLIVLTHIMTHSLTLTEDIRIAIHAMLINPPAAPYEAQTCPRWLNKELKFLLSALHTTLMKKMLDLLHKNLRRDNKEKKSLWATAFMSILTLAMVTESMQVSVRCKQATDEEMGITPPEDPQKEINGMDDRLDWLSEIFRQKYGNTGNKNGKGRKEFNPLEDLNDRRSLDQPAQTFACDVDRIVEHYRPFLESRRRLPGPPSNASEPRTSRLVARFLLSLYKPRPVIMQS